MVVHRVLASSGLAVPLVLCFTLFALYCGPVMVEAADPFFYWPMPGHDPAHTNCLVENVDISKRQDIWGGPYVYSTVRSMFTATVGPGSQEEVISAVVNGTRMYLKVDEGVSIQALGENSDVRYSAPTNSDAVRQVGTSPVCDAKKGVCYYVRRDFGGLNALVGFDVVTGERKYTVEWSSFAVEGNPYLHPTGDVLVMGETSDDTLVVRRYQFWDDSPNNPTHTEFRWKPDETEPSYEPKDIAIYSDGSVLFAAETDSGSTGMTRAHIFRLSFPDLHMVWSTAVAGWIREPISSVIRTPVSGTCSSGASIFYGRAALDEYGRKVASIGGPVVAIDDRNTVYIGTQFGVQVYPPEYKIDSPTPPYFTSPPQTRCRNTPRVSINVVNTEAGQHMRTFVFITYTGCPLPSQYVVQAFSDIPKPVTKMWEFTFGLSKPDSVIYSVTPLGGGLLSVHVGESLYLLGGCNGNGVAKPGARVCECEPGFAGDFCIDCECDTVKHSTGTCDNSGNCLCEENYFPLGDCFRHCEASTTCNGHGECLVNGICGCNSNYYPAGECSTYCTPTQTCSKNGACKDDGTCNCDAFHYGEDCGTFCNPYTTCNENGICSGEGKCICDSNSGLFSTYTDKCKLQPNTVAIFITAAIGCLLVAAALYVYRRYSQNKKRIERELGYHPAPEEDEGVSPARIPAGNIYNQAGSLPPTTQGYIPPHEQGLEGASSEL